MVGLIKTLISEGTLGDRMTSHKSNGINKNLNPQEDHQMSRDGNAAYGNDPRIEKSNTAGVIFVPHLSGEGC